MTATIPSDPQDNDQNRKQNRRLIDEDDLSRQDTLVSIPSTVGPARLEPAEKLPKLSFIPLTICLFGQQFVWTVELSYGTPYLLSLGLTKQLTALVWLAGPLSGLIAQPLIGALSDHASSKQWIFRKMGRRRPFVILSAMLTIVATLCIGYAKEIADLLHSQDLSPPLNLTPSKDPQQNFAAMIAVIAFYVLDFSLNALQATCRALIMDIPPLEQQSYGNAWGARMIHLGNLVGYFMGFIDLTSALPWLGTHQVQILCVVACIILVLAVGTTCIFAKENVPEPRQGGGKWYEAFIYMFRAIRHLPDPIQRVCNVQFFAWMGWFPFLFYSTTWVAEVYARWYDPRKEDFITRATRAGSFALLCYSIVSVISGTFLPWLTKASTHSGAKTPLLGALSRRPSCQIILKRPDILSIYTVSHVLFALLMISSFAVGTVDGATAVIASLGVCWAVTMWVPFTLVGEFVHTQQHSTRPQGYGAVQQEDSLPETSTLDDDSETLSSGMILGVHNIYVVMPQFIVAGFSSVIFKIVENAEDDGGINLPEHPGLPTSGRGAVRWVFAFGGFMALIAAILSRRIERPADVADRHDD